MKLTSYLRPNPLLTGSVMLSVAVASTVQAQTEATPAEGFALEEIVITAQKREESAQKAALSVTALSGAELNQQGKRNLDQILKSVPNVEFMAGGAQGSFVNIRGIGNTPAFGQDASVTLSNNGNFTQRGNSVRGSFYDIDRVEVARGPQSTLQGRTAEGGAINVISREPVLNELQVGGTLEAGNYHLVAEEAVVNAPLSDEFALRVAGTSVKRDGYIQPSGLDDDDTSAGRVRLLYQPNDALKLILSADTTHTGGKGPNPASSGYIDLRQPFHVANGYYWDPSPAYSTNDFQITNYYADLSWKMPWATLDVHPAYQTNELATNGYTLNVNNYNNAQGLAGGYAPTVAYTKNIAQQRTYSYQHQKTAEVRLSSPEDSRLKWLGGVYWYQNVQSISLQNANGSSYIPTGLTGAANAVGVFPNAVAPTIYSETPHRTEENRDGYLQLTYEFIDTWRATAGARYSQVIKDRSASPAYFTEADGTVINTNFTFPMNNGVAGSTAACSPSAPLTPTNCVLFNVASASTTYSHVNWKAEVEHDFTPDSLGYAMVSTGWKAGSFLNLPQAGEVCASGCATTPVAYLGQGFKAYYDPEYLTAYEIGSKNTLMNRRLRINASAFFYNYKGYQFNYSVNYLNPAATNLDPDFSNTYTSNAKKAQSYGGELESSFLLTQNDKIDLNLSYLHARLKEVDVAPNASTQVKAWAGALSNFTMPRSPEWTVRPGYSHVFAFGNGSSLTASADAQYEASQYLVLPAAVTRSSATGLEQVQNSSYYTQPSYWKFNASLSFTSSDTKWSLTGYIKNITNKATLNQITGVPTDFTTFGSVQFTADDPRTYGVILSGKL